MTRNEDLEDDYRQDQVGEIAELVCHTCGEHFTPNQEEIEEGEEPTCPFCGNEFSGYD